MAGRQGDGRWGFGLIGDLIVGLIGHSSVLAVAATWYSPRGGNCRSHIERLYWAVVLC